MKNITKQILDIKKQIDSYRPINESMNKVLQDRLRVEWTYNSNAIEGSTLTLGETNFFLQEGLTSEGKPFKDFLEAKNHAEAIDVLQDMVKNKEPITEFFIKSLHGILLSGVDFTVAKGKSGFVKKPLHVGAYKTQPNHVLTVSGEIHHYTDPLHVAEEMKNLVTWLNNEKIDISPLERAGLLHYKFVKIHPFDDGNGRMSRLLMNIILMQAGFPPCIVKNKNRRQYLSSLEKVDKTNNHLPFLTFIAQELLDTMTFILDIISHKESAFIDPFKQINKNQRKAFILEIFDKKQLSIGQVQEKLPHIKRPTLKKDLQELVGSKKLSTVGKSKGVLYFRS